jgi:hypothetical protein|tara:strand:+ start:351 stop:605 length:255 start_codon:yes stop_codon:yes gene_type:complete
MNYFGVKAIENIINQIEKLLSIKTLERKLEKTLKNKKISCYKLLTYDFIFWVLSLVISVYIFRDRIEELLNNPFKNIDKTKDLI